jgi:hypothetical protein
MEVPPGEEAFKHLPLRIFEKDQPLPQKLYKTLGADKQRLLLQDLLREAFPERNIERGTGLPQINILTCRVPERKVFVFQPKS